MMNRNDMLILIDNGHGNDTPGKRSPDGKFREAYYCREIAAKVVHRLRKAGYEADELVPELYDIRLLERVHRVNVKCQSRGKDNVLLVSIHCNAAGKGKEWHNASGWEVWTSPGITASDNLANCLIERAKVNFEGKKIREWKQVDGERDKEANFTILKDTLCPAVLTENFFMDNKEDVAYLENEEGKEAVIRTHVEGIINYIESL